MERSRPVDCSSLTCLWDLSQRFSVEYSALEGLGGKGVEMGMTDTESTSNNGCSEMEGRFDLESQFCLHSPLAALPEWLSAQSSKGASVIPRGSHCRSAPHHEWPQVQ